MKSFYSSNRNYLLKIQGKLLFFLLIFIPFLSKQQNIQFTYKEFAQSQSEYINYLDGKNTDTLSVLNLATKNPTISASGFYSLAKYYLKIDTTKSLEYLKQACYKSNINIDTILFKPILKTAKKIIEEAQLNYNQRINWELNNELFYMVDSDQSIRSLPDFQNNVNYHIKQDSIDNINQAKLKEITYKYGWPNFDFISYKVVNQIPLIIVHSPKQNNLEYLPVLIKEAQKGRISWFSPESIMFNLMWRFSEKGYIPFRLINEKNNFTDDLSFFEINTLKKVAEGNMDNELSIIHLYCLNNENLRMLKVLKEKLIEVGIISNNIVVHDLEKLVPPSIDFQKCNFAYKIELK